VFFLSYARPHRRLGRLEARFFDDVSEHVDELMGSPPGQEPGYMDQSMQGGELWSDDLRRALGSCHVFVPLVSERYVRSEWCAREWRTFARRPVKRLRDVAASDNTAILPVLWSPVRTETDLPEWLSSVQYFMPRHPKDESIVELYFAEGLYGLLSMTDDAAYKVIVWRLALRIRDVFHVYDVEPRELSAPWEPPDSSRGGER
jgi:hypothetical protein